MASAPFLVWSDWPSYRFDNTNSGVNPYENVLDPSNVHGLVQRWQYHTGNAANITAVEAGGLVFVQSAVTDLSALDARTGALKWTVNTGWAGAAPTVSGTRVYAFSGSGTILNGYNTRTGQVEWTGTLEDVTFDSSPTVAAGLVYVGDRDGTLYALDETTGNTVWTASTAGPIDDSPAVSDGVVYVGSGTPGGHRRGDGRRKEGGLFAFDALTGAPMWRVLVRGGVTESSPAVGGGLVFVAGLNGVLLAVRATDGSPVWRVAMGGPSRSSPAVTGTTVLVGSDDGRLHAFDEQTGSVEWEANTGSFVDESSPAVVNELVFIATGVGRVLAFDLEDGTRLWSTHILGYGQSVPCPIVANGLVYIGSDDFNLHTFGLP